MAAIKEACGLFGISSAHKEPIGFACHYGLYALQHRGQEGCGIALNTEGELSVHKDLGLVNEVFPRALSVDEEHTRMAIAHTRYGTSGERSRENVQPLLFRHHMGSMAIAHNGNLTNDAALRCRFEKEGCLFHTTSDTEVIAYLICKHRLATGDIHKAIELAMDELEGAYSLLIMTSSLLIAVRDPNGFRPLCLGKLDDGYVFASESCALDAVGAVFVRDLQPGELCIVDKADQSLTSSLVHCNAIKSSLCVFELIYFARPDSVIDTISVHQARIRSGSFLALEHPCQADVVIGVPDSGIDAAIGYSRQSGIPYGIGFIKNKYIGRTFIQPKAGDRESGVRIKLNPIASTVRGKRVVLIDDSIVRGTTSKRIVRLLREAGAKEVHLRSSAPPFLHPCYYGTDIDSRKDLFACKYDHQQMMDILDVDSLGFLLPEQVVKLSDHQGIGFCSACFTGVYPTAVPKGASNA
ncbi:amidophosphoribosyltransferase [Sphaerochaeta globosa]|uniref:Amidophosphoribosyltransferase n=1 Tax=Sphaerochaeta globosa (strain ATCC BAA-1886 / DSM 22777 / Buddy) TaxID=158189 RepID=F0RSS3_SPHGB|nr:amidophosphoribosyltransferase [Sphaerochaeta globosa]ADY13973.1 amidophosphoribosyltransferase [Sphaerochaeta globosa str. Buddy]